MPDATRVPRTKGGYKLHAAGGASTHLQPQERNDPPDAYRPATYLAADAAGGARYEHLAEIRQGRNDQDS